MYALIGSLFMTGDLMNFCLAIKTHNFNRLAKQHHFAGNWRIQMD